MNQVDIHCCRLGYRTPNRLPIFNRFSTLVDFISLPSYYGVIRCAIPQYHYKFLIDGHGLDTQLWVDFDKLSIYFFFGFLIFFLNNGIFILNKNNFKPGNKLKIGFIDREYKILTSKNIETFLKSSMPRLHNKVAKLTEPPKYI